MKILDEYPIIGLIATPTEKMPLHWHPDWQLTEELAGPQFLFLLEILKRKSINKEIKDAAILRFENAYHLWTAPCKIPYSFPGFCLSCGRSSGHFNCIPFCAADDLATMSCDDYLDAEHDAHIINQLAAKLPFYWLE